MDSAATNSKTSTPTTPQSQQHQSNMQPLYPNAKGFQPKSPIAVGAVICGSEQIEYNTGREVVRLTIRNTGDRPHQVGSHFHLFEVNRYLDFDRIAAFGMHLNIPATTAIRFEPGDSREVEAVPYAGKRRIIGFNHLTNGYTGDEDSPSYYPTRKRAICRMQAEGFKCDQTQQKSNKQVK